VSKGPTPICPSCGSAGVDHILEEYVCRRCKHAGPHGDFTRHLTMYADDPDLIQPTEGLRHLPHLTDEWVPDEEA
jgi:hypothetical protein